jgi:hypothetical protein
MASATERIPILVTPEEKARIMDSAARQGVSAGAYLRRAAAQYDEEPDEASLDRLLAELDEATNRAERAVDRALAFADESDRRIEVMESARSHEDNSEAPRP